MAAKKRAPSKRSEDAAEYFERTLGTLTFGRLLRSIRQGEEESLEVFAGRLGVSKSHLSDIEHDRRGVSVGRAAEWARILGYHEGQFAQLALQSEVDAAGLVLRVTVDAVPEARSRDRSYERKKSQAGERQPGPSSRLGPRVARARWANLLAPAASVRVRRALSKS